MENRNGLAVNWQNYEGTGTTEREATLDMLSAVAVWQRVRSEPTRRFTLTVSSNKLVR